MRPDRWLWTLGTVAFGFLCALAPVIAWGQVVHEVWMTDDLTFDPAFIAIVEGKTL